MGARLGFRVGKMIRSREKGQQMADFTVAFGFLVIFVILPLIDLGVVPVRFLMAQTSVRNYIKQLSLCETMSQAYAKVKSNNNEFDKLLTSIGGTHVKSTKLLIVISSQKKQGAQIEVDKPKAIQKMWLPDGSNCPCQYMIKLSVDLEISPLITLPKILGGIPGLSAPFVLTLTEIAPWENLGINPATQEYFINE